MNQVLRNVAWFADAIKLGAGLPILLLNVWHTVHHDVRLVLLAQAIDVSHAIVRLTRREGA